jgi:hypothetical protein
MLIVSQEMCSGMPATVRDYWVTSVIGVRTAPTAVMRSTGWGGSIKMRPAVVWQREMICLPEHANLQ